MAQEDPVYDPSPADGRFQLEMLGLRWLLIALYALFTGIGVIELDPQWFWASEGFLIAYHFYYSWYIWHELTRGPLPPATAYATPFLDTTAVTLALLAIGEPLHPIWGVYFFIIVGVAFFYYPVARIYTLWLMVNYACLGLGLQLRDLVVPVPDMLVSSVILLTSMFNAVAYTGSERRLRRQISEVARKDPLTNLLNRRGLEEALDLCIDESRQTGLGPAVFMLDIDRFKRVNDHYGHLAADGMLEQLGATLSEAVRHPDLVARFGGDEFVVIVPDVGSGDALTLAERMRHQVARLGLCTVSIGVAIWNGSETPTQLLDRADAALMEAKHAGRNCVRPGTDIERRAA